MSKANIGSVLNDVGTLNNSPCNHVLTTRIRPVVEFEGGHY